jgi:hypothetical protein
VYALLQTIVVVLGFTLWLHRAERLVREVLVARQVQAEKQASMLSKVDAIPPDLLASAQSLGADWARQDATDHLYELYRQFKDWDKVRAAVAIREQGTI